MATTEEHSSTEKDTQTEQSQEAGKNQTVDVQDADVTVDISDADLQEDDGDEFQAAQKLEGVSVKILTDMQRDIETLKREKAEQEENVLRTQAEMQNLRRRVERDIENAHKYALERFVQDLLPVVDSLDRGIETVPADDEAQQAAREGLVLTQKMLMDSLTKFSVEAVDPTGEIFNPQFHEAITMVPQPDLAPNTVISTVQKGYTLSGRLVRPAMVVVSKA